jgi:hypothetical protein
LPITGIVTTNYDRSLHEAYAQFRRHAALPLELRDETLRNAALISEFFVARIHGRAELPECMVVDYYDYERLKQENDYLDFVVTLLRLRPTAFIGFSFLDPAIEEILDGYKKNFGPNYPAMHLAVVPDGIDKRLAAEMAAVNIRVLSYDPADEHKELWRAIRTAQKALPSPAPEIPVTVAVPKDLPQSRLHRVIAFAYARTKAPTSVVRPALEMVQEGVLLAILNDEPSSHLEKTSAVDRLRELMRVDEVTAHVLFNQSFQRLVAAGDVIDAGKYIRRKTGPKGELEARLDELAGAVLNRLKVLYGHDPEMGERKAVRDIWERLFTLRSWDLAPQYAGSIVSRGIEVEDAVDALTNEYFGTKANFRTALRESFLQVIGFPDAAEADALAEISRTAITVQLLLSSPRHALSHAYTLPTKIYFDASVLLPAIAPGHPMYQGNLSAINRLQSAAKAAGRRCDLVIGTEFLEEIVVHRAKAIDLVRELKLEEPKRLTEHILFYSAENTNVFVGAFASLYTDQNPIKRSFPEFLQKIAPYKNEQELTAFLNKQGVMTESMEFYDTNNIEFTHIFSALISGYEELIRQTGKDKERILIQHEAQQLTRLFLDASEGKRTVFVTADRRLQRVVQATNELEKLTGNVLSHIGFIGLIDLLVGLSPDNQIFTRLVWATPRTTAQKQIRDYLVAVTLRQYDEAMVRAMPTVLDEVLAVADVGSTFREGSSRNATDVDEAKKTSTFLDRIESKYFEKMRAVVEQREKTG